MKLALNILAIFLLLSFYSCSNEEKNEISELLKKREEAFENKNEELYSTCISDNYKVTDSEKIIDKNGVIKNFKSNTLAFDKIEISHKDRSTYVKDNTAKVVQKTTVLLQLEDQKSSYKVTEIIHLTKEKESWKISKESKIDLFRGFVFGEN